jgi:hypothetical protein
MLIEWDGEEKEEPNDGDLADLPLFTNGHG